MAIHRCRANNTLLGEVNSITLCRPNKNYAPPLWSVPTLFCPYKSQMTEALQAQYAKSLEEWWHKSPRLQEAIENIIQAEITFKEINLLCWCSENNPFCHVEEIIKFTNKVKTGWGEFCKLAH